MRYLAEKVNGELARLFGQDIVFNSLASEIDPEYVVFNMDAGAAPQLSTTFRLYDTMLSNTVTVMCFASGATRAMNMLRSATDRLVLIDEKAVGSVVRFDIVGESIDLDPAKDTNGLNIWRATATYDVLHTPGDLTCLPSSSSSSSSST